MNFSHDNNILQVNNLSIQHESETSPLFSGLHFTLPFRKTLALVGVSGSGKSSLLKIISGLGKPTTGDVCFNGTWFSTLNEKQLTLLRKGKISFIYQNTNLVPYATIYENVLILTSMVSLDFDQVYFETLVNLLKMTSVIKKPVYQLSGGEAQRGAIIRALMLKPILLIADEPTSQLDKHLIDIVITIFDTMKKNNNCSIIVATHDPMLAQSCDFQIKL
ncbi:MAG: ABC transporter ATP-binding protein [Methylacidiphilales bacterium]|nr:ABC transporter ATP-binding protein [Candidatus Methylacidiphilales bacterium]